MDKHVTHQMTHDDKDDLQSHVSLGQCSHDSLLSDEETLPALTPRNGVLHLNKTVLKPAAFKYAYAKEKHQKQSSIVAQDGDTDCSNHSGSSPCVFYNQSELRTVVLPRLAKSEQKAVSPSRNEDNQQIKFPDINMISKANGKLALNRSITDLLDPEMEILNKIKHLPKRKRRKRRQKINPNSVLTLKTDTE